MKELSLLSSLVGKIELEILTTEESALIGGTSGPIVQGNNCMCNGNNCNCNTGNNCKCHGNNCDCYAVEPEPVVPVPGPAVPAF